MVGIYETTKKVGIHNQWTLTPGLKLIKLRHEMDHLCVCIISYIPIHGLWPWFIATLPLRYVINISC